ncbi:MAG: hypothetical protein NVS4B10_00490 [Myxococcales bacterium]
MTYGIGDPALASRLRQVMRGDVLFDPFARGRYSTDASIYQIEPIGVAVPKGAEDVEAAIALARAEGFPVIARGGGCSQNGQTLGKAVVLDTSRYMTRVLELDPVAGTVVVEPGIVLDELNRQLKPSGWYFPVDVSTSANATIGGMTGNNSAGTRSIKYGIMVHNVLEVEAVLADGTRVAFGEVPSDLGSSPGRLAEITRSMRALYASNAEEIALRIPKLLRKVGGYNIDSLGEPRQNLAKLMVGSEGTLGFFTRIKLKLHRILKHKVGAICHFERFHDSMEMSRFIVGLGPTAVELVDRKMLELARDLPVFRATLDRYVTGKPDAILLVEFAGDELAPLIDSVGRLEELMADHGYPNAVVRTIDAKPQADMTAVRKAGLNIMMSMKGDGKPISFIEDCAVPLEDLAEFTDRLTRLFHQHGTEGTWYAHASVGCLHVRPILNMKDESGAKKMRAIAEEAFSIVKEYKGSHSGEHGDGLSRSEFHEKMFGERILHAFEAVKDAFDPRGLLNPGKIVRAPKMDDRALFRYKPGYSGVALQTALNWSEWGGFLNAAEMCNNNGHCRKFDAVMCPSFQATGDEKDTTRGRANSLRLALSGQLGPDALVSEGMKETMDLCVGCKACRRECPTGVDMARMKTEFLHQWHGRHGISARTRLTAWLPRYAAAASRFAPLFNLRNSLPGLPALAEKLTGMTARRKLPAFRRDIYRTPPARMAGKEVFLFVDTFSRYFEPENARAARAVLEAGGYTVVEDAPPPRPLCCGRTFLSAGLVDQAREELTRVAATLGPYAERGVPIIGIEPSCILSLRDELGVVLDGGPIAAIAKQSFLLEEFLAAEARRRTLKLAFRKDGPRQAYLHGHCHQKAMGTMPDVVTALQLVPGLQVNAIESSCCGMAGSFGYEAQHYDVSMKMAERSLLPAVRGAPPDALIVADGTSCRHQIEDGAARKAVHVARVLAAALATFLLLLASPAASAAPDQRVHALAHEEKPLLVETLKQIVSIDSGSRDKPGLDRVAALIAERLRALGGAVEVIDPAPADVTRMHDTPGEIARVVLARFQGTGTRKVLLLAHMDTVYPHGMAEKRPFHVEGSRAYGPGIADEKGGVAMILHTLSILKKLGFRDYGAVTVLINGDEELSTPGARKIIERVAAEHDLVFSCEPSQSPRDFLEIATTGIAAATLTVRGRSAHAGVAPELGRNALLELAHQILQTRDLSDAARGIKFNWTTASAGTTRNVIPDLAIASADVRVQRVEDYDRVERAFRARTVKKLVEDTVVEAEFERRRPPLEPNDAARAAARKAQAIYAELGRKLEVRESGGGGGTDAAFAALSGKPGVLENFGLPGFNYHSSEAEYVDLDAVEPRLYLLARLIQEVSRRD